MQRKPVSKPAKTAKAVPPSGLGAAQPPQRSSLTQRHTELTRQCIVEAAADLLEENSHQELTNAAVAARAGIAERTVYRHFPSRDALLDALGAEVTQRIASPPVPESWEDLVPYVARLYASYEARPALTKAALATDVFPRMREGPSAQRGRALELLLAARWPQWSAARRSMLAAHLRYLLTATTWNYHRQHFGLDAAHTVRAVQSMLAHLLRGLEAADEFDPRGPGSPGAP